MTSGPTDIIKTPDEIYQNFENRKVRVAAFDNWPFIKVVGDGTIGMPTEGIDYNVLMILSKKLNFT